jgi:hypothetical protein
VLTNGGFLTIADFEFVSPRASVDLFIPQRLFLPYGCWTEADGASVLFSRDYLPLWRLRDGKPPERVESWLWIKFVKQEWFFRDGEEPWANRAAEAAAMGLLNERGLHRLPMSADALPLVLRNPSAHNIHDGADLLRDLRTSPAKRIGEHVGDAIQHLN